MKRRAFLFLLLLVAATTTRAQDTYEALIAAGNEHYEAFENREALAAYEQAHTLQPDSFEVLALLARTYNDYGRDRLAENQRDAAEKSFETAVSYAEMLKSTYPDRAETYFLLAASYGNLALFKGGKGKVETGRAVEAYSKKAVEIDSTFALPYVVLGIFYREVASLNWLERTAANALFGGVPDGSKAQALDMIQRAIELDPDLNFAHYEMARTYESMDEQAKAAEHYRKVIELPPYTSEDARHQQEARALLQAWRTD
jgi:tetratricopeptide (TPR) repeat protein